MGEAKRKRREDKVQVAWDKMCNDAIDGHKRRNGVVPKLSKNSPGVGRWMKKLKERREATVDELIEAQAEWSNALYRDGTNVDVSMKRAAPVIKQDDINVFATMEAAWQDFVDHWAHVGLPDKHKEALRLAFYTGVQSAANLMRYCEGQGEFNLASDQIQEEEVAYYKNEVAPKVAEAKDEEWRTGEI